MNKTPSAESLMRAIQETTLDAGVIVRRARELDAQKNKDSVAQIVAEMRGTGDAWVNELADRLEALDKAKPTYAPVTNAERGSHD
jgi:histidinol dehydrogenase